MDHRREAGRQIKTRVAVEYMLHIDCKSDSIKQNTVRDEDCRRDGLDSNIGGGVMYSARAMCVFVRRHIITRDSGFIGAVTFF